MSKSISFSNNNITSTQEHSNALSAFFNTSKIYKKDECQKKNSKIKMISLNSTPNTLNKKNFNSFCSATINNTYSNEMRKDKKKNSIPMSLSSKSSKRYFSVSQGYPNFSKSFNKKYRINKRNKSCINYLEPKNNKYIGIDLNLVSNSSRRNTENKKKYFKVDVDLKINNNNDIYEENFNSSKKIFNEEKNNKDNSSIYEKDNKIKKNNNNNTSNSKINKKIELNSSTSSHIRQNSHLENASVNQSTPVSSFHPYEADSSPTNYIKSYSNINNLTYLTNNNSKKNNNKNDEEDEKRSVSYFGLNQSEFTYFNNSNKISEKEEEKRIGDKLEKINKIRKNKNNKKKRKNDNISDDNNYNNENININNSYFNSNNKINENKDLRNTIEEKEEEYINSINNKLKISREKEDNETLEEIIKYSKDQDTIYYLKKTEENEKEKLEKEEIKLRKELEEEKEKNRKEEERINLLKKEKEIKEKEIKEIKDCIKKEKIYRKNLEKKAKLLEIKLKNEEIKSLYEEEEDGEKNNNGNIEIKDTNFMNNVNQVTFNAPKSTINAKLNFNYYSSFSNLNEKYEKIENKTFINPLNIIGLKEDRKDIKEKNSSSYFYDYGSNAIISKEIFYDLSKNNNKRHFNNNKIEKQNFAIKQKSCNKLRSNNPEKQFELEIKPIEEKKKKNNDNTFSSFNFGFIQKDNLNNKRKIIKKYLMNENIMKDNSNLNPSFNNKNTLEYQKEENEETITKDISTQYNKDLSDKHNKNNNLFLRNYIKNSGNNNFLKTEFKNEFLNKTKSILFDFEAFKANYKIINKGKENQKINNIINIPNTKTNEKINTINNIPHHNKIGRNKGTIWNEYVMNNSSNTKIGKIEETYGLYSINKTNKNKFNRKLKTFVFPANPFDSVNKAREYYFFNN